MAVQKGIIKIQGKLDGLSFYRMGGKDVVRKAYGPSRERIHTEKSFERTRELNQEFAGASLAGKALRGGLSLVFKKMSDSYCTGRVLKLCKEMIAAAEGVRGQRPFLPASYKEQFCTFNFHQEHSFENTFRSSYNLQVDKQRKSVTLQLPSFNPRKDIKAPKGATHLRITNLICALSAYRYNAATNSYEATDKENNSRSAYCESEYLPLRGSAIVDLSLTATLRGSGVLGEESALIACMVVEFYQQIGEKMYLLQSGSVMKIGEVFAKVQMAQVVECIPEHASSSPQVKKFSPPAKESFPQSENIANSNYQRHLFRAKREYYTYTRWRKLRSPRGLDASAWRRWLYKQRRKIRLENIYSGLHLITDGQVNRGNEIIFRLDIV